MGVGGQCHAPATLPPGKTQYLFFYLHLYLYQRVHPSPKRHLTFCERFRYQILTAVLLNIQAFWNITLYRWVDCPFSSTMNEKTCVGQQLVTQWHSVISQDLKLHLVTCQVFQWGVVSSYPSSTLVGYPVAWLWFLIQHIHSSHCTGKSFSQSAVEGVPCHSNNRPGGSMLLGCDTALLGTWYLTFKGTQCFHLCSFQTTGTNFPATQCHTSEEQNPEAHCCENLKIHNMGPTVLLFSKIFNINMMWKCNILWTCNTGLVFCLVNRV